MMAMLAVATPTGLAGQAAGGRGAQAGQGGGQARAIPQISERTSSMQKIDGFFPLYWDEASGSLFLEIPT
ncbi:MAG: hypothetical protein AB7L71_08885, partial [Vicinamibacterales bacterium]